MFRIRRDDTVQVISGKDKGKSGRVLMTFPGNSRILVEGVNYVKRHTRPNPKNPQGGIFQKEAPIHISNIMFRCARCGKPVKLGVRFEGEEKVRYCKRCKEPVRI